MIIILTNRRTNMNDKTKIHGIIHTASVSAAGVGTGLAQVPCSDALLLGTLQAAMIVSIAAVYGHKVSRARAVVFLSKFTAKTFGRKVSQVLVGWMPGIGNAINASTAAALTEAVGWAANSYFRDLPAEKD
jgi:uncharacterized protein (DUF697 family)